MDIDEVGLDIVGYGIVVGGFPELGLPPGPDGPVEVPTTVNQTQHFYLKLLLL